MQETTHNDGSRLREFFDEAEAAAKFSEAMFNPKVKEIRQVLRIGRNDPCPCGGGMKFKKCCIDKVDQGPEEIAPQ